MLRLVCGLVRWEEGTGGAEEAHHGLGLRIFLLGVHALSQARPERCPRHGYRGGSVAVTVGRPGKIAGAMRGQCRERQARRDGRRSAVGRAATSHVRQECPSESGGSLPLTADDAPAHKPEQWWQAMESACP